MATLQYFAPDLPSGGSRAKAATKFPRWALAAVLIFVFGSLISPPLVALGTLMALVGLAVGVRGQLHAWAFTPTVAVALLLGLWVPLRALLNVFGSSEYEAVIRPDDVWAYVRIAGPLGAILGLYLAMTARHRYWVLAAFILSWLFYIGRDFTVAELVHALEGARLRLGHSPTELSMFGGGAAMAGLGCILSAGSRRRERPPLATVSLLVIGLVGFSTGGLGLLLSLTRSAWLGFAFVFPIVLVGWAMSGVRSGHLPRRLIGAVIVLILTLAIVLGWAVKDMVAERFAQEADTIDAIMDGEDDVPFRSWGKRYVMYTEGISMIAERPLTGYGPGTIRNIRKHYDSERLYGSGHFHSFTITAGVALGIVWTAVWFGLAGMLLWRGTQGFIRVLGDPDFAWAAAGLFGFYLTTSQFQVRMFQNAGAAYLVAAMSLLFAGSLLFQWHHRKQPEGSAR